MSKWKIAGIIATLVIVLIIPAQMLKFYIKKAPQQDNFPSFTGTASCIECHQIEYKLWFGSDHYNAMDTASDKSVLGNFNDATFENDGIISRFYKKDNKFFVFTAGPKGEMNEYEIKFTFGIRPLQQYLVEFDDGRFQCLPIAWDTEKKQWYSLSAMVYHNEKIEPDNWLYWTNNSQNWNGMCAECHSTELKKNFDPVQMKYNTTWTDINVGCEACHGPGLAHLDWAMLPEGERPMDVNTMLVVKTSNINNREYVDNCARCHSRRSGLSDFDNRFSEFMDYYIPQLAIIPEYYVDGQIKEEDYEYASFLQSKMFMKGVKCSDCHNAHSLNFVKQGNDLCLQCHRADQYDVYSHHFHKKNGKEHQPQDFNTPPQNIEGEGARCINCHMDGEYYMGVDFRRDHSFRIPRPDMTIKLGVPNACNSCHKDKTAQWSEENIIKWYGLSRKPQYGEVFAAGNKQDPAALGELVKIAKDELQPPMVRASAVGILSNYNNLIALQTLKTLTSYTDPLIRYYAVRGFQPGSVEELKTVYIPLLSDQVRSIRFEAALRLSYVIAELTDSIVLKSFNKVIAEYEQAMLYTSDFSASRHNLGILYTNLGKTIEAENQYLQAIKIDNLFFPSKVNLAQLYNTQGKNEEAEKLFREILSTDPGLQDINYSFALLLAELNRTAEAETYFEKAVAENPSNPRIYYNYGLLLNMVGKTDKAETMLQQALSLSPDNPDFLYALSTFNFQIGRREKALGYAKELERVVPDNPDVKNLLRQLGQ